jgi:hypothetical protein
MRLRHGEPAFSNRLNPLPNGLALSCEPQRLRGSLEAPEFDAKRYHGSIGTRCGSQLQRLVRRRPPHLEDGPA